MSTPLLYYSAPNFWLGSAGFKLDASYQGTQRAVVIRSGDD